MKSKMARITGAPSARKRSASRKPKAASLATPKEVAMDDAAFEIARVWIGKKKMTAALSLGRYLESGRSDEPAIWGVILADLARHVARGLRDGYSLDEQATLAAMSKTFERKLRAPSSPIRTSKTQ